MEHGRLADPDVVPQDHTRQEGGAISDELLAQYLGAADLCV
jgi:hypothetical protein